MKDGDTEKKAANSEGDVSFAGAVAVTIVTHATVANIDSNGFIESTGNIGRYLHIN